MHWRRNLPSALETVVLCHDKRHARKLRAASRRIVLFLADTGYCTPESHVSGERTGNDRRAGLNSDLLKFQHALSCLYGDPISVPVTRVKNQSGSETRNTGPRSSANAGIYDAVGAFVEEFVS